MRSEWASSSRRVLVLVCAVAAAFVVSTSARAEVVAPTSADTVPDSGVHDASSRRQEPLHATRATEDELTPEGPSHVLDVATLATYVHVTDDQGARGLTDAATFTLRVRSLLGRQVANCAGFDGHVGGSNTGFAYGAVANVLGLGTQWGDGNLLALCGGVGLDGVVGSVPLAARFPAEAWLSFNAGPIRLSLWGRVAWLAGSDARRDGSETLSFVDELEAGLLVRLSRQHHYWARMNAGGGVALGVTYREWLGTRMIGLMLGVDFVGAQ